MKEIKWLIASMPFNFHHRPSHGEWGVTHKQLAFYLVKLGKSTTRRMPEFVFQLSKEQKMSFFEWLWKGDGLHSHGKKTGYCAASVALRDSVFNLLLQLGYGFSFSCINRIGEKITIKGQEATIRKLAYVVHLKKGANYYVRRRSITETTYRGNIFNLRVTNGIVMIERNGRFTWIPCLKNGGREKNKA